MKLNLFQKSKLNKKNLKFKVKDKDNNLSILQDKKPRNNLVFMNINGRNHLNLTETFHNCFSNQKQI